MSSQIHTILLGNVYREIFNHSFFHQLICHMEVSMAQVQTLHNSPTYLKTPRTRVKVSHPIGCNEYVCFGFQCLMNEGLHTFFLKILLQCQNVLL